MDADDYTAELKHSEEESKQSTTVCSARKKAVELHHGWKAKEYKDMPKGSKEWQGNAKFVSNHTHYSQTDPDARISVKPGKPRQLNYHAQVSADTAHHVITAIHADHANKKEGAVFIIISKEHNRKLTTK